MSTHAIGRAHCWDRLYTTATGEYLRAELQTTRSIGKVAYYPRQMSSDYTDGSWNGVFWQYEIYVASDPNIWGAPVATGTWTWPNRQERKDVTFAPKQGRYVIFRRVTAYGWYGPQDPHYQQGVGLASAGEVWVYETNGDTDNDQIPDSWEQQYFGGLGQKGAGDWDGDGLSNLQEYLGGTNPLLESALQVFTPMKQ